MKKKISLSLFFLLVFTAMFAITAFAAEEKKSEYGTLPPASVQERIDAGTYNLSRAKAAAGQWIQDTATGRWWYRHDDGSFTTDDWEQIGDRWYHFDGDGWMQTGWFTDVDGKKYYLHDTEGYMMVQWVQTGGKWYYMDEHGVMVTGWVQENNNKYYYMRPSDGSMVTGTYVIDGITCYFNTSSGVMEQRYLGIVRRKQQKSKWCWIASAEMIGKYVNPSSTLTQGDVATAIAGLGLLDDPNFSAWFPAARKAVEMFGADKITGAYIYGSALDYLSTGENIEAKRPILAYLSWDLLSGHDVVVSGYTIGDRQIRLIDPWENTPTTFVPYDQAIVKYQFQTGYGTYKNSIYIGR